MSRDRLLVLDASLGNALAAQLRVRGHRAIAGASIGLASADDPGLLRALAARFDDEQEWVLVTIDDALPGEQAELIRETRPTIATILPAWPEGLSEYGWYADVVHRQAHRIQAQTPHAMRRYGLARSQPWRPRAAHTIAPRGWQPWPENEELT
jgi:hypothetical protein